MDYKVRSVRLSDDVWERVKASELSANQLLKRALELESATPQSGATVIRTDGATVTPKKSPRVHSEPNLSAVRAHSLHSGARPIPNCPECAVLVKG